VVLKPVRILYFSFFHHPVFPPLFPAIWCTPFMCWLNRPDEVKQAEHILHAKGFSPVCIPSCAKRAVSLFSFFSQCLQWNCA